MKDFENHYEALHVPENASEQQIRNAVKELLKEHHPDKGGSVAECQRILRAKAALFDPGKRRLYDEQLALHRADAAREASDLDSRKRQSSERFQQDYKRQARRYKIQTYARNLVIAGIVAGVVLVAFFGFVFFQFVSARIAEWRSGPAIVDPVDASPEVSPVASAEEPQDWDYLRPPEPETRVRTVGSGPGAMHTTITAALEAAKPGDTIELQAGTYSESLVLTMGVAINGSGECIIEAPDGSTALLTARGATGASLRGVTLRSEPLPGTTAILLEDSELQVSECIIEGFESGIVVSGPQSEPNIAAVHFKGQGQDAITVTGGARGMFERNTISSPGRHGVLITGRDTDPVLADNFIEGAGVHGVNITNAGRGLHRGNRINGSKANGVRVEGALSEGTIVDNEVSDSGSHGIAFLFAGGGKADGNIISRSGEAGIFAAGEHTFPVLRGNRSTSNKLDGIKIGSGANAVVLLNVCERNEVSGIAVIGAGTSATVVDNRCAENRFNGIEIANRATGFFKGNTCNQNENTGILVSDEGTRPTLINNSCRYNKVNGITFIRGAEGEALDNVTEMNIWAGIGILDPTTAPRLDANTIAGNGQWSVYYGRR